MEIANLIASIILTGLGILVSYLILRVQLREENKAVLVFEKDGVRNIGNTSALNVSVYQLRPNLGGD